VPFGDITTLARTLDARAEIDLRWRGGALDRLIDARHADLVEWTVRWLSGAGWTCMTEVSFAQWGERGSIDVVGRHPSGAWAVIEDKASIGEANATLIALDRKARLFPEIAKERGWPPGPVGVLLVVADGTTARRRIGAHGASFRASLPTPSLECRRWVRTPGGQPPRGIVFLRAPNSQGLRDRRPNPSRQT
jgi:hypothetical protein